MRPFLFQTKEYWKNQARAKQHAEHGIGEGDAGIFATCDRGREARCVEEMYGLLEKVCCAKGCVWW